MDVDSRASSQSRQQQRRTVCLAGLVVLVAACTDSPQNKFLSAVVRGDVATVESLLDDPSVDVSWRVPKTGDNALGGAAAHNRVSIVKVLLQEGVDPNIATFENMMALHSAAYHGNVEIAALLIDAGANVDAAESRYGFTPLAYAARNGHIGVVKLLLDAGAQPNIAVKDGRTALVLAQQNTHREAVDMLEAYASSRPRAR